MNKLDKETLRMDEHKNAELGFIKIKETGCTAIVYDYEKIVDNLSEWMYREEAYEYVEFNIMNAWVGNHTPVIRMDHGFDNVDYVYFQAFNELEGINDSEILPIK